MRGLFWVMTYLLVYLRASWRQRWMIHVLHGILLICAVSLPLCLSILEESSVYGAQKSNDYYTDGHAILVHNAALGDETYFSHLAEVVPVWTDDKLYLDRVPEYPLMRDENGYVTNRIYTLLMESGVLRELENAGLRLENLEDRTVDVNGFRFGRPIWSAILLFSLLLQQIVHTIFARKEREFLRQLVQLGASRWMLRKIGLAQAVLLQLSAYGAAIVFSTGMVRFFTSRFMAPQISQIAKVLTTTSWIAYHVDWRRIGEILALFFCVGIAPSLLRDNIAKTTRTYNAFRLRIRAWRKSVLPTVFRRAHYANVHITMLAMLPVLIAAVLLLRLHPMPETTIYRLPEYPLSVILRPRIEGYPMEQFLYAQECGWTRRDLQGLETLDGIAEIWVDYEPLSVYLVDDRTTIPHKDGVLYERQRDPGFRVTIFPDPEMAENTTEFPEETDAEGHPIFPVRVDSVYRCIALPDDEGKYTAEKWITYEPGEIRELWTSGNYSYTVRVADVLTKAEADARRMREYAAHPDVECFYSGTDSNAIILYMRPADYEKMVENRIVSGFQVKPADLHQSYAVQKAIYSVFGDEGIKDMINYAMEYEVAYNRAVGMNLLYTTLSLLLFAFFAIITTLSLIDYAASHRETIRLLHMQGASHRSIVAAFVEIMLPPGILTCAAVWAIVTPVEREYYRLRGYSDALMAKLDLRMIDDPWYLLAAVAVVAVFVAPVMGTVIRELRRLDRG